jgi:hypothetical protein
MSAAPRKPAFDLSKQGFDGAGLKALIASGASVRGNQVTLEPYGVMIAEVQR